jgi:hypothetical protein
LLVHRHSQVADSEFHPDGNHPREFDGRTLNFITRKRKELLEDDRTFTVSVISEILSLVGHLPLELYQELTKARKARNRWVHDLKPVSRQSAEASGKVAEQMLRLVEDVDLEVPASLQLHG